MLNKIFNPMQDIPKKYSVFAGITTFLLFLALWSLLSYSGFISELFLPTPDQIIKTSMDLIMDGAIITDILVSFSRVTAGFLLAALIGVPLGMAMGSYKIFQAAFEPFIGFIRYMPASAFIPLFILWIGLGESEKVAVIFFGTFFQLTLMIMDVTKNVQNELIEVSYTLGAKRHQVFMKVLLPASLPGIVDTLRITFGWAWTYLVVAELVGASSGLGYRIMQASRFLNSDEIIVGILIIGLLGLVTDLVFRAIYRLAFGWMRKEG